MSGDGKTTVVDTPGRDYNGEEEYVRARPQSQMLRDRAASLFGDSGATHSSRAAMRPFGPYIAHASGSHVVDVDGIEYVDYTMGHGALLMGHSHPSLVSAVQTQVQKGVHFGSNHPLEVEWAEAIKACVPQAERVEFFSCGQEANLMALRVARLHTHRNKVLHFKENFHGWADQLSLNPNFCASCGDTTCFVSYNLEEVAAQLESKQYSLVMAEGGGGHMGGQYPVEPSFLQNVLTLAHDNGTLFLLDEVVTGFRDCVGGFSEIAQIKPDLTTYGKIVGGGLPAGVLCGSAALMSLISKCGHTGTWNANPLAAAAGIAMLKHVITGEPQRQANNMASVLRDACNDIMRAKGLCGWAYGRSIVHIALSNRAFQRKPDQIHPPWDDPSAIKDGGCFHSKLSLMLRTKGITTLGGRMFIVSSVHSVADINQTARAFGECLDVLLTEGLLHPADRNGW
ncbi:aminotransferase class III-fold pyridoxal phosphate-dependent enzyme [Pelomyxa schiedti]|nr:aminotransferase class III-fold pyridoxal phosphate-dependent enzyme [Pelomyxa schiedti]